MCVICACVCGVCFLLVLVLVCVCAVVLVALCLLRLRLCFCIFRLCLTTPEACSPIFWDSLGSQKTGPTLPGVVANTSICLSPLEKNTNTSSSDRFPLKPTGETKDLFLSYWKNLKTTEPIQAIQRIQGIQRIQRIAPCQRRHEEVRRPVAGGHQRGARHHRGQLQPRRPVPQKGARSVARPPGRSVAADESPGRPVATEGIERWKGTGLDWGTGDWTHLGLSPNTLGTIQFEPLGSDTRFEYWHSPPAKQTVSAASGSLRFGRCQKGYIAVASTGPLDTRLGMCQKENRTWIWTSPSWWIF